jgi:AcrR family transcriptional regulator
MARKTQPFERKRPKQARARATVEAILEAAAHILVRQGHDALTTNSVAERAGVSIGSLYQYFPNKEALVTALSKKHLDDIEAISISALEEDAPDIPLAALVRSMIDASIAAHLVDPALHDALSDHLPNKGAKDWHGGFEERVSANVKAVLVRRRAEIAVKDLDLAVYVIVRSVEACIHDAHRACRPSLKSSALAEAVTRLVMGYLTQPDVTRSPRAAAQ